MKKKFFNFKFKCYNFINVFFKIKLFSKKYFLSQKNFLLKCEKHFTKHKQYGKLKIIVMVRRHLNWALFVKLIKMYCFPMIKLIRNINLFIIRSIHFTFNTIIYLEYKKYDLFVFM